MGLGTLRNFWTKERAGLWKQNLDIRNMEVDFAFKMFQVDHSSGLRWFSGASLQHLTAWLELLALETLKEASKSTWSMEISWEFMRYPVDSRLCDMLWRYKMIFSHPQALHKWFCNPTHCFVGNLFSFYAALLGSPKLWSFSWRNRSTNRRNRSRNTLTVC